MNLTIKMTSVRCRLTSVKGFSTLIKHNLSPSSMSYGSCRLFSLKKEDENKGSPRMQEFRKKLRERTPIEKLEELEEGKHPYQEKEPLSPFPNNTNPETGEIGGPRGPEPTRYGDWERKGRVSDF